MVHLETTQLLRKPENDRDVLRASMSVNDGLVNYRVSALDAPFDDRHEQELLGSLAEHRQMCKLCSVRKSNQFIPQLPRR